MFQNILKSRPAKMVRRWIDKLGIVGTTGFAAHIIALILPIGGTFITLVGASVAFYAAYIALRLGLKFLFDWLRKKYPSRISKSAYAVPSHIGYLVTGYFTTTGLLVTVGTIFGLRFLGIITSAAAVAGGIFLSFFADTQEKSGRTMGRRISSWLGQELRHSFPFLKESKKTPKAQEAKMSIAKPKKIASTVTKKMAPAKKQKAAKHKAAKPMIKKTSKKKSVKKR